MEKLEQQDKDINVDEKVNNLYKRLRAKDITKEDYTEAVAVIKHQRRRIGALQGWNNRYRVEVVHLKKENATVQQLKHQVAMQKQVIQKLVQDKTQLNQQMQQAIQELEEYENKVLKVQSAYEQASRADGTMKLWDRFNVLLLALKELFSPTPLDSETNIKEVNAENLDDKPWMKTDQASIGKALLDD
jgi:glutamine amidotransferase-like uncharacterized protein